LYLPLSYPLLLFTAPSTTNIYTLSLHDALPIYQVDIPLHAERLEEMRANPRARCLETRQASNPSSGYIIQNFVWDVNFFNLLCLDRKSTRLNSSHRTISYAVFCLKKKKNKNTKY